MRWIAILLTTMAAWAAGPENVLVVQETSGLNQPSRPVRFGRVFAEGEIRGYPKVFVDGAPAAEWQSTVKTRWRDGQSSCDITGASNEQPITITCADHGFRNGELVRISGVAGNTAANGTWKIVRRSRDQFFLVLSSGNGAYTSGGNATGPGPGSVKHAILVTNLSLSANESVTLRFKSSADACHQGDESVCEAAALGEAQMMAWNSFGWDAEIRATQGITHTANARTMLDAGDFEYWVRGPILTEVVLRDLSPSRRYDFGWDCLTNCTDTYSGSTWGPDTTHRSLSPLFRLSFYSGMPDSVQIRAGIENMWWGHLQDQRYAPAIQSGADLSVTEYSRNEFVHFAKTRWSKVFWDGAEPGEISIDHSGQYLQYSGIVPVMMTDAGAPGQAEANDMVAQACGLRTDLNQSGCFVRYLPTTGGRAEIGVLPRWENLFVITQDPRLWDVVIAQSEVVAHIPIHFRDANADGLARYFLDVDGDGSARNDEDDNVAGNQSHGRPISVDARPEWLGTASGCCASNLSSAHGWTIDWAHQASYGWLGYLLTGDAYYLEEMQFWGTYNVGTLRGVGKSYSKDAYGLIPPSYQVRGQAWGVRNIAHPAWASPDGTFEKDYYSNKLNNNLAAWEGRLWKYFVGDHYQAVIGAGPAEPCAGLNAAAGQEEWTKSTPFCYGRQYYAKYLGGWNNPLAIMSPNGNPAFVCSEQLYLGPGCGDVEQLQKMNYLHAVFGHLHDLKLPVDALHRFQSRGIVKWVHPEINPYLSCTYNTGVRTSREGKPHPVSPADHMTMFSGSGRAKSTFSESERCWLDGYLHIYVFGALAGAHKETRLGPVDWRDAWSWYTSTDNWGEAETRDLNCVPGQGKQTNWIYGPRFDPTKVKEVRAGTDEIVMRYTAPAERSCSVAVYDAPEMQNPVFELTDSGGARGRRLVAGGLEPGRQYYYELACQDEPFGGAPLTGSIATPGSGGASSVTLRLNPPPSVTVTDANVRYGPTPEMLTNQTGPTVCAVSCTPTLPATTGEAIWYKTEYLNGGEIVSSGRAEVLIP